MKNISIILACLGLLISQSCMKEELISTDLHQDFKIDTIFSSTMEMGAFRYSYGQENISSLVSGGYILLPGYVDPANSVDIEYKVLKIDLSTGALLWEFKDFEPGDGSIGKISVEDQLILFQSFRHAYLVDTELGNKTFTYDPEDSTNFNGAALGGQDLYVVFSAQTSGSWLQQVNPASGNAVTIKHLPKSQVYNPLATSVHYLKQGDGDYILMEVKESGGNSFSSPTTYLYAPAGAIHQFRKISLPSSSSSSSEILEDALNHQVISIGVNSTYSSYDLRTLRMGWMKHLPHHAPQGKIIENRDFLFLNSIRGDGTPLIINKKTGNEVNFAVRENIEAANNTVVLSTAYDYMALRDPQGGQLFKKIHFRDFQKRFNHMFRVSEDEFLYLDYQQDSTTIGKIRVTPVL